MKKLRYIAISLILTFTLVSCASRAEPLNETAEDVGFVLAANISRTHNISVGETIEISTRLVNTNTLTYDVTDEGQNIYIDFYKEGESTKASLPARIYQITPSQEFTQNKTIIPEEKGSYILDIYSKFSVKDPVNNTTKVIELRINQLKYNIKG